jgi:hypothetical protein
MFEIAVATSSVNSPILASVPVGRDGARPEAATMVPHSRPSMTIGTPTAERTPSPRTYSAIEPVALV